MSVMRIAEAKGIVRAGADRARTAHATCLSNVSVFAKAFVVLLAPTEPFVFALATLHRALQVSMVKSPMAAVTHPRDILTRYVHRIAVSVVANQASRSTTAILTWLRNRKCQTGERASVILPVVLFCIHVNSIPSGGRL